MARPRAYRPKRFGEFLEGTRRIRDLLRGEVLRDDVVDVGFLRMSGLALREQHAPTR